MIRRLVRAERGAAIVEFAIVTPVLIGLLLGTVEVGRYTYMGIVAAHAAHAAVQYAAQNPTTALNLTAIKNAATADTPNPSSWTVTPTHQCQTNGAPIQCPANNVQAISPAMVYYVQVSVTGTFTSLLQYPGIPNHIPVTATASMRVTSQ